MLGSLRTCAISIATASILASGLRGIAGPALASAGGQVPAAPALTATDVHYLTEGAKLDAIELTVPGSGSVKVRLAPRGHWFDCTRSASTVRCETPGQTVAGLERVEIAAA